MSANFPHITISVAHDKDGSDAAGDLNTLSVGLGLLQAWFFTTMFGAQTIFEPSDIAAGIPALSDATAMVLFNAYVISFAVFLLIIGLTNQLLLRFYVGKQSLILATSLLSAGTLLIFAAAYAGTPAAFVSGLCMGIGSSLLIVMWGTAYARYEFTTIILNSVVAVVIAVAVYLALENWVLAPFSGLLTSLLPIGSSLLLWRLTPIPYYRRREIPIFHPLSIRQGVFLLRFGIPTLIFGFALGILRDVSMLDILTTTEISHQLAVGASAFLAVVIVMFAVAISRGESHWDMIFRMLIPFIAAAIFCLPYLASAYELPADFIILCGFICFESLMWIFFSDLSQEFRLSPIYVFGLGRSLLVFGAILSLGMIEFPLVSNFSPALISHEMAMLVMAALVIAYCLLPRQREVKRIISPTPQKKDEQAYLELRNSIEQAVAPDSVELVEPAEERTGDITPEHDDGGRGKGRFHAKCEEIADRYLLSRRETEVMFLLAKGHNAAYIQDKLCISKSTAKTHINHIYRKLDIHTQQELLNMVEERAEEAALQNTFAKPRK